MDATDLGILDAIARKVLWLSTYMVHHANAIRPNHDGTKVGGHQASSSSLVSILTALYFRALRTDDVVAVKAHASPAFYAIQYLRGRLDAEQLRQLRVFGGLQAYPSRRKNPDIVDLSTGSMGLGAVQATFAALGSRYVADHFGVVSRAAAGSTGEASQREVSRAAAGSTGEASQRETFPKRFIVMVGDAELDEGNVWEALLEETMPRLGNVIWIVDLNRQSLDRVVPETRRRQLHGFFGAAGWHVIELRWGSRISAMFGRSGGERLRARLEAMPAAEYHWLLRSPAGVVRKSLVTGSDGSVDRGIDRLVAKTSDEEISTLIADVGGHDLVAVDRALTEADGERERPTVILADTIKGWGLPLAADPLNHTTLLTAGQIEELRASLGVPEGQEWAGFADDSAEAAYIRGLPPLFSSPVEVSAPPVVPFEIAERFADEMSTQEAFGRVLGALGRTPIADRIVTVSADVAVTTHLAGWINRKGVYFPVARPNAFADVPLPVQWKESPAGQHVELGIAEHNLFLLLGALGLSRELTGVTLLPIGTLYDPFVTRGLDALYHALYAGGRFVVAATPSGVSLSGEGGAHQSVITPGIGIAVPNIAYFDPAFAREVEWILLDALGNLSRREGESLYLRLSTKPVDQRLAPPPSDAYRDQVLRGGYRLIDARHEAGYSADDAVHLFATGVMVPEAVAASRALREHGVFANVFVVTSPDRLYRGLRTPHPYLLDLVTCDEEDVPVVSVLDGHSHGLAFLGAALGVPQMPLGVDEFGQSGARADLYVHYGIDAAAIVRAARTLLAR